MQAEPLITWSEPAREFVGFVAQFLAVGAVGFRFAALRGRVGAPATVPATDASLASEGAIYRHAARRAATLGLFGAFIQAVMLWESLPAAASRAHLTVGQALTSNFQIGAAVWLLVIAIIGFAIASSGRLAGWWLALIGVVVGPLVPLFLGKWLSLVNPVHRLMGGFWIGTLLVLVLAGLGTVLRDERSMERRGQMAADMVNGFSPFALTCASILVLSGVITAWRHLTPFSSLWTTPYGWTLIVKLCFVAGVFALGAWNWKRQRPQLGSEGAAVAIRRSSRTELVLATCVLVATAILLSLPSPRSMQARARGARAEGGAPGGATVRSAPAGVVTPPAAPAP
jgi:putative copper export protein